MLGRDKILRSKGFRISRMKRKCTRKHNKFSITLPKQRKQISMQYKLMVKDTPQTYHFQYFGQIIHENSEIDDERVHRTKARWLK